MKKTLLLALALLIAVPSLAQEEKKKKNFFKELYADFLKYGTVYAAGDIRNAYENSRKDYFVERPPEGDLYSIPRVIEVTEYFDFDYKLSCFLKKLVIQYLFVLVLHPEKIS